MVTKICWSHWQKESSSNFSNPYLSFICKTPASRLIIAAFSFAILNYSDGSREFVWLLDGTVGYLSGKHIALFLVALSILLAGIVYTSILFFWQWILRWQNMAMFRWVRNQQLCHFLEPYHAPYAFQHRYWTGLFLILRVILYTVAAVNVSNDPAINLLAIGGSACNRYSHIQGILQGK